MSATDNKKRKRGPDPPLIAYHSPLGSFMRPLEQDSLYELVSLVRTKLGLNDNDAVKMRWKYEDAGMSLDDNGDFIGFSQFAHSTTSVITVDIIEPQTRQSGSAPAVSVPAAPGQSTLDSSQRPPLLKKQRRKSVSFIDRPEIPVPEPTPAKLGRTRANSISAPVSNGAATIGTDVAGPSTAALPVPKTPRKSKKDKAQETAPVEEPAPAVSEPAPAAVGKGATGPSATAAPPKTPRKTKKDKVIPTPAPAPESEPEDESISQAPSLSKTASAKPQSTAAAATSAAALSAGTKAGAKSKKKQTEAIVPESLEDDTLDPAPLPATKPKRARAKSMSKSAAAAAVAATPAASITKEPAEYPFPVLDTPVVAPEPEPAAVAPAKKRKRATDATNGESVPAKPTAVKKSALPAVPSPTTTSPQACIICLGPSHIRPFCPVLTNEDTTAFEARINELLASSIPEEVSTGKELRLVLDTRAKKALGEPTKSGPAVKKTAKEKADEKEAKAKEKEAKEKEKERVKEERKKVAEEKRKEKERAKEEKAKLPPKKRGRPPKIKPVQVVVENQAGPSKVQDAEESDEEEEKEEDGDMPPGRPLPKAPPIRDDLPGPEPAPATSTKKSAPTKSSAAPKSTANKAKAPPQVPPAAETPKPRGVKKPRFDSSDTEQANSKGKKAPVVVVVSEDDSSSEEDEDDEPVPAATPKAKTSVKKPVVVIEPPSTTKNTAKRTTPPTPAKAPPAKPPSDEEESDEEEKSDEEEETAPVQPASSIANKVPPKAAVPPPVPTPTLNKARRTPQRKVEEEQESSEDESSEEEESGEEEEEVVPKKDAVSELLAAVLPMGNPGANEDEEMSDAESSEEDDEEVNSMMESVQASATPNASVKKSTTAINSGIPGRARAASSSSSSSSSDEETLPQAKDSAARPLHGDEDDLITSLHSRPRPSSQARFAMLEKQNIFDGEEQGSDEEGDGDVEMAVDDDEDDLKRQQAKKDTRRQRRGSDSDQYMDGGSLVQSRPAIIVTSDFDSDEENEDDDSSSPSPKPSVEPDQVPGHIVVGDLSRKSAELPMDTSMEVPVVPNPNSMDMAEDDRKSASTEETTVIDREEVREAEDDNPKSFQQLAQDSDFATQESSLEREARIQQLLAEDAQEDVVPGVRSTPATPRLSQALSERMPSPPWSSPRETRRSTDRDTMNVDPIEEYPAHQPMEEDPIQEPPAAQATRSNQSTSQSSDALVPTQIVHPEPETPHASQTGRSKRGAALAATAAISTSYGHGSQSKPAQVPAKEPASSQAPPSSSQPRTELEEGEIAQTPQVERRKRGRPRKNPLPPVATPAPASVHEPRLTRGSTKKSVGRGRSTLNLNGEQPTAGSPGEAMAESQEKPGSMFDQLESTPAQPSTRLRPLSQWNADTPSIIPVRKAADTSQLPPSDDHPTPLFDDSQILAYPYSQADPFPNSIRDDEDDEEEDVAPPPLTKKPSRIAIPSVPASAVSLTQLAKTPQLSFAFSLPSATPTPASTVPRRSLARRKTEAEESEEDESSASSSSDSEDGTGKERKTHIPKNRLAGAATLQKPKKKGLLAGLVDGLF